MTEEKMATEQQPSTINKNSSPSFSRQLIKRLSGLLLILIVLICLLVAFLLTPWGAKTAVNVTNNLVAELTVEYQSGSIGSELYLSSIKWQKLGSQFVIKDLRLSLRFSCLWRLVLCIDSIEAEKTLILLKPTSTSADTESPNSVFTSVFPILIQKLNIGNFSLQVQDTVDITWQKLTGNLDFYQDLSIESMLISGFNLTTFAVDESNMTTQTEPFNWAKWQYEPITSVPIVLPIHFDVLAFNLTAANIHLAGQPEVQFKSLSLKASANKERLQVDELVIEHAQGQLLATGNMRLNGRFEHVLSVDANGTLIEQTPLKLALRSSGNIDSLSTQVELIESHLATKSLELKVDLTAQLSKAILPVNLQLNWRNLAWPIAAPEWHSDTGNVQINGDWNALKITVQTMLAGSNAPDTQINLNAIATSTAQNKVFELNEFLLETLGGQLSSKGRLTFSEFIDWQGSSIVSHIDPSVFWPQWVADINGDISTQASNSQGIWKAKLQQLDIIGQWQGYPLSAKGEVDFHQNNGLQIQNLSLKNADNSLLLNGFMSQQQALNLDFVLDAKDLSNTVPQLGGAINILGSITGSASQPEMSYELAGTELTAAEVFIQRMTGTGKIHWNKQKPVELNLELVGIQGVNNQVDRANIRLSGNAQQHQLDVTASGKNTSVDLSIQGQLNQMSWQGSWLSGNVLSSYANLTLLQPFVIDADWGKQQYSIAPHCWRHMDNELCIQQAEFKHNTAYWDLSLREFDLLSVVRRFVPTMPKLQTNSRLNLDFSGDWHIEKSPQASLHASLTAGDWVFSDKNKLQIRLDEMLVNGQIDQQHIFADLNLAGSEMGVLRTTVKAPSDVYDNPLDRPIQGELVIEGFDLATFKTLFPQFEVLQGAINGQANIDGTLGKPLLTGKLDLSSGALKGESLPVSLSAIEQNIVLNGQSADFKGRYKLGDGAGEMHGNLNWTPTLLGHLNLSGEALEFEYQSLLKAKVSPNINILFEPNNLEINGEVTVPYARVKVRELPEGSISPSKDVILVEQQAAQQASQQKLKLNVLVKVDPLRNNQVKLDAFGLTTDLQGHLTLQNKQNLVSANGDVELVNGRYRAYGQNLIIRQGDIIFNGSLDRPFLNIEAVRDPILTEDNVVAGLWVQGVAQSPTVTVFSEPTMEQQQSLSYILTGQGLGESSSDSQDVILTNALLSLGLGKSENLVSKVGHKLGFEDVNLDTSGQGNETQLSLTGTIAPGVQLRYGVGVFDSVSEVAIRYELLPKLYLEAVSGLNNAIDIYYQFSLEGSLNRRVLDD